MTVELTRASSKNGANIVKYPLNFVLATLHSSMNQEPFKKKLCNQNSHYQNMDDWSTYSMYTLSWILKNI